MTATPARTTRPPEQVTLADRRYYTLADGTQLPSVTTILGNAIAKPALPAWAAKSVATTALANLGLLVTMCHGTDDIAADPDGALKWLKGRPYAQRDAAADVGTRLHELAEAHSLGRPYAVPDPATDEGRMLAHFLQWIDDWRPEFVATEAIVVNRTIGYAGSLDSLIRLPAFGDRLFVLDYKTGRSGPHPEWALQVGGAYGRAEELWRGDVCEPMPRVDGALILRLRPDGYAIHEVTADLDDLHDAFAHAVGLSEWAQGARGRGGSPFSEALSATVAVA